MAKKKIAFAFLLMSFANIANAEQVRFSHLTFTTPQNWQCDIDDKNMICLDKGPNSEKNAAIVLTYKAKSPQDNFTVYRDQLTRPRSLKLGETTTLSQPMGVRELALNGTKWIEGIHFGSELSNYYTHYYATTIGSWAYLISVSIEKSAHQSVLKKLQPTLNSFVFEKQEEMNAPSSEQSNQNLTQNDGTQTQAEESTDNNSSSNQLRSQQTVHILGYNIKILHLFLGTGLIIVLGMMGYALMMD